MKLFLNNHLLSALAIATVFGCSAGDQSNLASSQQALRATGSGPASLSTLAVSKKSAKKLTGLKTASVRYRFS